MILKNLRKEIFNIAKKTLVFLGKLIHVMTISFLFQWESCEKFWKFMKEKLKYQINCNLK